MATVTVSEFATLPHHTDMWLLSIVLSVSPAPSAAHLLVALFYSCPLRGRFLTKEWFVTNLESWLVCLVSCRESSADALSLSL